VKTQIEISNVSRSFSGKKILHDISFSVYKNEFFSIFGKSGCGKTTLLKLISNIYQPDIGGISIINDEKYNPKIRRPTATVWQSRALYPHLNVKANVEFGLKFLELTQHDKENRLDEITDLLQINNILHRSISNLSGGELQKVALARALIVKPEVLLLDEPFTGIDEFFKDELREELRNLFSKIDSTFIMVSHDVSDVTALSDRILVLEDGKVSQIGAPDELFNKPNSLFIAKSFGQFNVIPGVIIGKENNSTIIKTDLGLIHFFDNNDFSVGAKVFYLIKPSDIKLSDSANPSIGYTIPVIMCRVNSRSEGLNVSVTFKDIINLNIFTRKQIMSDNKYTIGSEVKIEFDLNKAKLLIT